MKSARFCDCSGLRSGLTDTDLTNKKSPRLLKYGNRGDVAKRLSTEHRSYARSRLSRADDAFLRTGGVVEFGPRLEREGRLL